MLPWKVIFLGNISGFSSAGKILTCLFPFSDILIKFVSAFEDTLHPDIREGNFHCLMNSDQIDGNEGSFFPISERTDAFMKIKLDI